MISFCRVISLFLNHGGIQPEGGNSSVNIKGSDGVVFIFLTGILPEQNPCFTGRHGCDINAMCRPGEGLQFTCECAAGFTGDGRYCHGNTMAHPSVLHIKDMVEFI